MHRKLFKYKTVLTLVILFTPLFIQAQIKTISNNSHNIGWEIVLADGQASIIEILNNDDILFADTVTAAGKYILIGEKHKHLADTLKYDYLLIFPFIPSGLYKLKVSRCIEFYYIE